MTNAASSDAPAANRRVFLTVLDACGIGAMPDAGKYHDPPGSNTLGNVARVCGGLQLPNLGRLGLTQLVDIQGTSREAPVTGSYGRVTLKSPGKDTTTGHWEIGGIVLDVAFDVFPDGFPSEITDRFVQETGCGGILANHPASGTAVIEQYRSEHEQTGKPIIYTSADSVFQIACDIDVVPTEKLYEWCEAARRVLNDVANVGRVIARPYQIVDGLPQRLGSKRRDYAVPPPRRTMLSEIQSAGGHVFAIGKIEDIFLGSGICYSRHTGGNSEGIAVTLDAIDGHFRSDCEEDVAVDGDHPQLIFTNLVDTDALYGHRNDPRGFGRALEEIDAFAGEAIGRLREDDLLILVADHGCDPTLPGTDHTREFVPLLAYSHGMNPQNLGTLDSLTSVSDFVLQWLQVAAQKSDESRLSSAA